LPASEFERHIAYDIGGEAVTRALPARLGVPAVLGGFSRLLIDPNRGIYDPTLIRQLYDGTIIPGNYPLPPEERQNRIERFYQPCHHAVAEAVDGVRQTTGGAPLIIAIHS
ncbi:N-formylglutamate amidohydrolase, partial [Pantoea sp. SIMBA_133]